MPDVTLKCFHE